MSEYIGAIKMSFIDKVNEVMKPYSLNILNESAKDDSEFRQYNV